MEYISSPFTKEKEANKTPVASLGSCIVLVCLICSMGSLLGSPTLRDKLCMPETAGSEGHGEVQGPDHSYAPPRSHPALQ